jgi:hypothetical protein
MGSLLILLLLAGTGTALGARFAGDVAEALSRLFGNGQNEKKDEEKDEKNGNTIKDE